ncbi:MAG TPA: nucleotidyltransferase family protein [Candidatus Dormibacteraeota bacterium]|nr:nucleotidyltransferase family protein [Candidatus Dormibacteraeota bacterium]
MKAMVLAAGLGTRLRPLTNDRPKALVELNGRTLLEITFLRLRAFGIREVIVNVHHFADLVIAFLKTHDNFGMRVEVSREDVLLDTGGGLKKAGWFFQEKLDKSPSLETDEPFLLHNVDVISTIDFAKMLQAHRDSNALATLAVQKRESSRQLLFSDQMRLCGRRAGKEKAPEIVCPGAQLEPLAFTGIHLISPRLLALVKEDGIFSIIDCYLRLAAASEKITAFRADEYYWRDLGKPADLQQAALDFETRTLWA